MCDYVKMTNKGKNSSNMCDKENINLLFNEINIYTLFSFNKFKETYLMKDNKNIEFDQLSFNKFEKIILKRNVFYLNLDIIKKYLSDNGENSYTFVYDKSLLEDIDIFYNDYIEDQYYWVSSEYKSEYLDYDKFRSNYISKNLEKKYYSRNDLASVVLFIEKIETVSIVLNLNKN